MTVPRIVGMLMFSAMAARAGQPGDSVLLLGEPTVARTKNLTQQFFSAKKHPSNPVLKRTEAWEGAGPYVFLSRLLQNEKTSQLRMWYVGYHQATNQYGGGYATSFDGLNWNKPDLGKTRFQNATALNCLGLGSNAKRDPKMNIGYATAFTVDPRPGTPPERRYMAMQFTYGGEYLSFSADGIDFVDNAVNPVWHVPSDAIHVMWDDRRQKFIGFYKIWELKGREVIPDRPAEGVAFIAHMPFFTPKELGNGTAEFEGPVVTFRAPDTATVETRKFILRSGNQSADDGGGVSLSGEWNAKRVQGFAESDDGVHWSNEQVILRADDKDTPTSNIQIMFVIPYGGYYLAFLTLHDQTGKFRIQLAWSADGLQWERPSRAPWLDVGPQGAFDSGMILGPSNPIFQEREMWFPYGGFPIHHDTQETNWESAIGMATMRLDGFAAWEAGAEAGELVTQPFCCNGDRLFVNADAQNGSVAVEVLDEKGAPIKGFESNVCRIVHTDTLAQQSDGWIQWQAERDLKTIQGKQIQLRFTLENAQLYSFRVADEKTMKLPVPRATTR